MFLLTTLVFKLIYWVKPFTTALRLNRWHANDATQGSHVLRILTSTLTMRPGIPNLQKRLDVRFKVADLAIDY